MQNTARQTTTSRQGDLEQEITQEATLVGTAAICILSALIGAWGLGCFISGILQNGASGVIKGWITAVMGG